jgi:hypothetical protein
MWALQPLPGTAAAAVNRLSSSLGLRRPTRHELTEEQRAKIQALSDEKFDYLTVVHGQRQQANADAIQAATLKFAQGDLAATKSNTRWATTGWIVASAVASAGIVAATLLSK